MTHCPHCGKALNEPLGEVVFSEKELTRFWKHVNKSDDCWVCDLAPSHTYARLFIAGRRMLAHVVSWIAHNGQIPEGKKVCHSCDNTKCVRPDHLFLGTNSENMRDMVSKGRNKPMSGEKNGLAKLSKVDVVFIRDSLSNKSLSIKELSVQFGVSFQNIYRIALGKTWKHLGGAVIERRPVRHLTDSERTEIIRLASSGVKQQEIADQFDLWQCDVSHVVNGTKHHASKRPA